MTAEDPRRAIPAVDRLLEAAPFHELVERAGRERVVEHVRDLLDEARRRASEAGTLDGEELAPGRLASEVERRLGGAGGGPLRRLLNATGVVLHTNLGRAPLAAEALDAVREVAGGYSNLELDLAAGDRGSRHDHCAELISSLTGAEDAAVVNNNAAAVALALDTLARGRAVAVSRGELVEIGGGFRIPEVLERAGARLVEVGTTNRTRAADYRAAARDGRVSVLLKVHRSNFRQEGFTGSPSVEELSGIAADAGLVLVHDLGSGLLSDPARLGLPPGEPAPRASLAAGAHVVAFSGDKLLGGPQAGILAGRADLIRRFRRNPLARALRVGKTTLAALAATLGLHRSPERALERVPALRMLAADPARLRERAVALAESVRGRGIGAEVVRTRSAVGGGSAPGAELESWAVAVGGGRAGEVARALRGGRPPVVGRIRDGRVVLDLRTVAADDDGTLARRIGEAAGGG